MKRQRFIQTLGFGVASLAVAGCKGKGPGKTEEK